MTADEPAFIGPGLAYLQTGDLRLESAAAHPPLLFILTAAPLLLQPHPNVTALDGWGEADLSTFSRALVTGLGDGLDAATFAARLPILLLALLGASLVFRWAADWFGPWAGLAALALFTLDPNILAHATLATTDLGLAVFGLASAYLMHRLLQRPSMARYLATGLTLGLTVGAKSSGVFVLTILPPLFLAARLCRTAPAGGSRRHLPLGRALAEAAGLVGLALVVLWGLYRFEVRPVESFGSLPLPFSNLPLPFATQWETWLGVQSHARWGHTAYLMGQISDTGWWYYYPIAFLLKTPLPILMFIVLATISFIKKGWRRWWSEALLWAYPIAYVLVTLFSTIAIGYRFLLVVLPFTYVFVARLFRHRWNKRWVPLVAAALGLWYAVGTAQVHPHYLAYFNELAGGPQGGHRHLVDSNLDWGQSFKALRTYLEQKEIEEEIYLSYYTYADPALYGIDYQPIAPARGALPVLPSRFDPAPGVYAISATALQGVMVADRDTYDWFRHREPVARPGVALFVYRVEPRAEPATWLAQCTAPVAPLSVEAAAEGFGQSGLRVVYFDCTSAWLYPTGDRSPGWYALFRDTARNNDRFIQTRLAAARLSYEQHTASELPPFAIYEQDSPPVAPRSTPTASFQECGLTFLGYTGPHLDAVQPGQTVEIETWWQVTSVPARPLSIMMHLVGPEGTPVVVGDGLGVPIEGWQAGDVIVQRHLLALTADAPSGKYTPATGVYWLDTMERCTVKMDGEFVGDQLPLPVISITAQ